MLGLTAIVAVLVASAVYYSWPPMIAERIAIESYREMIAYLGDTDPTTQRMLKEILATEEEHADELASLTENIKP